MHGSLHVKWSLTLTTEGGSTRMCSIRLERYADYI